MRGLTGRPAATICPADADVVTLTRAVLVPLGLSDEEPRVHQARARWGVAAGARRTR